MKKLFLITIFILFMTGCNVTSNITINDDLSVQEEVKMTGTDEFFAIYNRNSRNTVINDMLELDKDKLIENNYDYKIIKENNYPYVVASKNYRTIEEFTSKTIFKEQYFTDFQTTTDGDLVSITASGFKEYVEDPEYYAISNCAINIKVPFVVTDNNADSYNQKTNTYTWNIELDSKEKEIHLTFDKSKTYVYNFIMYISLGVLILLGIIIVFITIHFVKKNKLNNKLEG